MTSTVVTEAQKVVDKIVAGLKTQGGYGWNGYECVYLDEAKGNKCAIGQLIPDGHPAQRYQGGTVCLLADYPELEELDDFRTLQRLEGALRYLQCWHDRLAKGRPSDGMVKELAKIGIEVPLTLFDE